MHGVVNCLTSQTKNPEINNSHQHHMILDAYDTNRKNILCLTAIQAAYYVFLMAGRMRGVTICLTSQTRTPRSIPTSTQHHMILDIYPRKNIMSSCNLRCVLIFPYGRAHAWCGYLSHLPDKKPRDQFPSACSTIRFLTYIPKNRYCV